MDDADRRETTGFADSGDFLNDVLGGRKSVTFSRDKSRPSWLVSRFCISGSGSTRSPG